MQRIFPYLLYKDVTAASEFVSKAFGLRRVAPRRVNDNYVGHSHIEVELDDGSRVRMNSADEDYRSPRQIGHPTSMIQIDVTDIGSHFARAKNGGATIVTELKETSHGDRAYVADDLEGQRWHFVQRGSHATGGRIRP